MIRMAYVNAADSRSNNVGSIPNLHCRELQEDEIYETIIKLVGSHQLNFEGNRHGTFLTPESSFCELF